MSAPIDYLNAVRKVLQHLERTQLPAIERAADLVAASIRRQGVVYCCGIGHGTEGDFIDRAGGLAAVQKFSYEVNIHDKVPKCREDQAAAATIERDLETVRFAVRVGKLRAGDVMVTGSVSGRNRAPVELALACREKGLKVIGFTAMEYTRQVESLHPSGKKLCEVADSIIDIGAPYGDAAVKIPGYEFNALPVSGAAMTVAGHMLWGCVMEKMAATGDPATVFMSINRENGKRFYEQALQQYQTRGY